MKLLKAGLKVKILTLILIFISLSAIILIFSTYTKLRSDIFQKNDELFQTFANTFYSEKDILTKKYSMSLDILMENRPLMQAFKEKDRQSMHTILHDLYKSRLKHIYNIEQFQFHLPPATSFYRAHAPNRYGDDLSPFRKTVLAANTEKNMIAGLEVGRAGLGLRVVKPVWYNYDFIGTVELGGNIENMLSTPASSTNVDYAVGVYTKALQRSKFFYTDANRYTYKDMYMYNYSAPAIKQLVTSGQISKIGRLIHMQDRYYVVKNLPLKDFSADHIGYLFLARDTTDEVKAMHHELIKQALIIFSYALATIALLTIILVKMIFNPLEKITTHIASIQSDTKALDNPIHIDGQSEITILADTFNILNSRLADSFEKINNQVTEIQQINTSLERRVQERTKQLEETNTRLKSALAEIQFANEAKSEFLANMSHEIRTPMNAVLGLSYLLMQTDLSAKQYDHVSKIRNSANLLLEIINDVLDFSKIEAGKLELENSPFNLKDSVRKLAGMVEVAVSRKSVQLNLDIDDNIPEYLLGDPIRVTQVLNNLGTNAAKFTDAGSISITLKLMTQNKDYARIKVIIADTGIGIPADKLPILFDSFTQVKRKNQKKQSGSGLGLSITKKILDAMNSDISVESTEGQGSTFTFTMTLMIADEQDIKKSGAETRFTGKRVLVCEPPYTGYSSITSFYRENLADVLSVTSYFDLLKQLSQNIDKNNRLAFDLIVINTTAVTKGTFNDMAELLKETDSKGTPIIVVSADNNMTAAANHSLVGFRLFILHEDQVCDNIPELSSDLLAADSIVLPDVECLKRNKLSSTGLKALIVDDNDINLQVITEYADLLGITYHTARNGYEAIKTAEANDYDIILMDIIMPEMDGITATENIRKMPRHSATPIYALSASTMPEDIEKCRRAGMNGHIAKPVKLQDLTLALKDCSLEFTKGEKAESIEIKLPAKDENLNTDKALENLNMNTKLYSELLKKYYSEYTGLDIKTKSMCENEPPESMRMFFHTIKGVSLTLGADRLHLYSSELEKMLLNAEDIAQSSELQKFYDAAMDLDLKLKDFYSSEN